MEDSRTKPKDCGNMAFVDETNSDNSREREHRPLYRPNDKVGKVWTFCCHCKVVEETEVGWMFYDHGIWPSHQHGLGTIGLQVFNTKEQAEHYKATYVEPRFGVKV